MTNAQALVVAAGLLCVGILAGEFRANAQQATTPTARYLIHAPASGDGIWRVKTDDGSLHFCTAAPVRCVSMPL
jgi:hypothetical protein